jgi:ADP-ribose pyrophosphatase
MDRQILDTERVIDSPWLTVTSNRIQTPDGQIIPDYYLAHKANFSMALPILPDNGGVLLLKEWKQGAGDYCYNFPAGGIADGETPLAAMQRELKEETGYVARESDWEFAGSFNVSSAWLDDKAFLYIARNLFFVSDPRRDFSEDITVLTVSIGEALEMVLDNRIRDPYSALLVLWAMRAT